MKHKVNISLQLLPGSKTKDTYEIIDRAIEIIAASGIHYRVCPFETVMEGDYEEIMQLISKIHTECMEYGAENILSFIKVQISKDKDVLISDKTGKYDKA